MSRKSLNSTPNADLLPEYDFSVGIRGKYAARYAAGSNVVVLDPDVAAVFRDGAAVNGALRTLVHIAQQATKDSAGFHADR